MGVVGRRVSGREERSGVEWSRVECGGEGREEEGGELVMKWEIEGDIVHVVVQSRVTVSGASRVSFSMCLR